jgi:tetratricopeptide (TPR) repeat protein
MQSSFREDAQGTSLVDRGDRRRSGLPWERPALAGDACDPVGPSANRHPSGECRHKAAEPKAGKGTFPSLTQLAADEVNLLNARVVAGRGGRWQEVLGCIHGLRVLYRHVGRNAEWAALLREVLAEPAIAGLADNNINDWRQLLDFQVELARDRRDWDEAEWLTSTVIDRDRDRAASALAADSKSLTDSEQDSLRWLAAGLVAVGHIMRERRNPGCLRYYHEAAELYRRLGDSQEEHGMASNLADAYIDVLEIRDLGTAEKYYEGHLQSLEAHDQLGRARVIAKIGRVAYERFLDGRRASRPEDELVHHLNQAARAISDAFNLTPPEAQNELAYLYDALGTVLTDADVVDDALDHYRKAIRIYDDTDRYRAGRTRLNMARALAHGGRIQDALMYARAAVHDFESEGAANTADIEESRRIIENLKQDRTGRHDPEDPDDGPSGVLVGL